ncbi:MAG TPA: tripartite tricarboxylate transporter substrate binding protein, partial [Burkholderiaceae bacterium]|nr:tripartite tricarboxylate transporter substrate binding protein [Burkholderiaceae bacterium]
SPITTAAPLRAADATYPDRPIRLVIPFGPGGETDIFARAIAGRLGELLGQAVVVENRPGATGLVACELVAQAKPDGYTLIFGTAATHALNLSVFKSLPYHPLHSFEPVAFVGSVPLVLYAHPSMPGNLKDFIALLKANPEKYAYGSAGMSTSHLGVELFKASAAVEALNVPYKGTGLALQDLVAGQVQFMGGSVGVGLPMVQAGKLRALGVMSRQRLGAAPDVPTFAEAGMPDLEVGTWNVVMAPQGTPKAVVEHLNRAINEVLREPAIHSKLDSLGIIPVVDSSPASTADTVGREIDKWAKAFELSGAQRQ